MKTELYGAAVVVRDGVIENGVVVYEDDRIVYVGTQRQPAQRHIDAKGAHLLPGFVDLHCHGGMGLDFMDATEDEMNAISRFHLLHGTTTMLATVLTATDAETEAALQTFSDYKRKTPDTTLEGLHLEGPWFHPAQCGAQDPTYMQTPNPVRLRTLKERFPSILRVSAAPELENGLQIGDIARERGIVMSAGHTDATFAQIEQAVEHGYTLMTHLYSGMKGVTRKNSYRIAGAVEAGLYFDDLYVELIADGRHLPAELLRFVYKIKGAERICLVTDAVRASGMQNGQSTILGSRKNGLPVIVEDDVAKLPDRQSFAGSTATYDRLVKTFAVATGAPWTDLAKMSSLTPATVMGLCDRGEIAVGKKADFVLMDDQYSIQSIIKTGEIVL